MTLKEAIQFWVKSANEDFITAQVLFECQRFVHCLFFCHLFVEKILKASVVKAIHDNPPYSHKLVSLAQLSRVNFTKEQLILIKGLTEFNLKARYDDIKLSLYKKANKDYTQNYFQKCKELFLWLKGQI